MPVTKRITKELQDLNKDAHKAHRPIAHRACEENSECQSITYGGCLSLILTLKANLPAPNPNR